MNRLGMLALRGCVVFPGALVEGALAVLLPWMVAREMLHSASLGVLASLLVLVPLLGTLAGPVLSTKFGALGCTVAMACVVIVGLACAGISWALGETGIAFGCALAALAADAVCDLLFAARLPLLARLSRQRLVTFSSGNWLWGLPGAVLGSLLAGWAINYEKLGALSVVLVIASALVAAGLAVLLPRDSRCRTQPGPGWGSVFSRAFWTRRARWVTLGLVGLIFFVGPLDNLLIPTQLAAHAQPATLLGYLAASAGVGVALGLIAAQSQTLARRARESLQLGLLALAAQISLLLWLPPTWILLSGVLVTSALMAPLLPLIEAKILTAANAGNRALLLATLAALMSGADVLGTLCLGAIAGVMGSEATLLVVLACVGVATLVPIVLFAHPGSMPKRNRAPEHRCD